MGYSATDVSNNVLLRQGTLEEAREAVVEFINSIELTRSELGSREIVPTHNGEGGILEEKHIFKIEDIDERIVLAIIKHDSV